MSDPKVFCVGFRKTGTSSLGNALGQLGHRVAGYYPFRHLATQQELDLEMVWPAAPSVAEAYEAAQDTSWSILNRHLHKEFPGAKFTHVRRDPGTWIRDVVKDSGKHHNEIHRLIYGSAELFRVA